MQIAVKDLLPNPFRHLERYPINQEKVEMLARSIKDTSFWDNIVARKATNGSVGKFEIAYGHHRWLP
jgi:ParB-like chromosome segregation protein Spo0J